MRGYMGKILRMELRREAFGLEHVRQRKLRTVKWNDYILY